jgi:hypothetical protein
MRGKCEGVVMKRISTALLVIVSVLAVLGSCNFILGPDEPGDGGTGNLVINIGGATGRAITSGADLPGDILDILRYELTLTGPGGSTLSRTLSGGENLSLTMAVGEWRIDAQAYQDTGLAGTGSVTLTVGPGANSVRVPMNMSGPCYEITVDPAVAHGTAVPNFNAAFPGAIVTVSVTPDAGYIFGSLQYHYAGGEGVPTGSGTAYTFTMPAADVTVHAEFIRKFGFTIEGPGDLMVTVNTVYSEVRDPPAISWTAEETVTFSVDAAYSIGAGNLKWLVNGDDVTATGSSLTIEAKDYILRTYTLTAMIKADDDLWYSGNYEFTVVR